MGMENNFIKILDKKSKQIFVKSSKNPRYIIAISKKVLLNELKNHRLEFKGHKQIIILKTLQYDELNEKQKSKVDSWKNRRLSGKNYRPYDLQKHKEWRTEFRRAINGIRF